MNRPGTEHTPVSGISPPAASLRSWTAAGLKGEHEAIFSDAEHRSMKLFFDKIRLNR